MGDLNPRFGFAWQPGWAPNTVIRGAYDISSFMEGNGISNMAVINPPNKIQISQIYASGTDYPANTFSQGYSPYQKVPCTASQLVAAGTTGTPSPCLSGEVTHATDPNIRPAMNEQWNFTLQHQFHNNFTASVGYVGNHDIQHGRHLLVQPESSDLWYPAGEGPGRKPRHGSRRGSRPLHENLVKAGVSQARFNASDAVSNFDALEVTVSQRNHHGLDMQANYTHVQVPDQLTGPTLARMATRKAPANSRTKAAATSSRTSTIPWAITASAPSTL